MKKIFKINEPDWREYLSVKNKLILKNDGVEYPKECFKTMVSMAGKSYYNCLGSVLTISTNAPIHYFRYKMFKLYINRIRIKKMVSGKIVNKYTKTIFDKDRNIYFDEFDHRSDQYIKDVKSVFKKIFQFPSLKGEQNKKIAYEMQKGNSVAIYVRRSDHMYDNADLIERGYFDKAVNSIKSNTKEKLSFFVFSYDISWCKKNIHKLGINLLHQNCLCALRLLA